MCSQLLVWASDCRPRLPSPDGPALHELPGALGTRGRHTPRDPGVSGGGPVPHTIVTGKAGDMDIRIHIERRIYITPTGQIGKPNVTAPKQRAGSLAPEAMADGRTRSPRAGSPFRYQSLVKKI